MADQEESKPVESEAPEEKSVTPAGDAPQETSNDEPAGNTNEPKQEVTEDAPTESGDKAPEAEPEGDKPTEDGDKPTEESKPNEDEEKPEEGEEKPAEGDEKPAEGEEKPAEGDEKPAEGDEKPAEGEEKPAEGDVEASQEATEQEADGNQEQAETGEGEKPEVTEGEAGEKDKKPDDAEGTTKEGEEEATKEGEEGATKEGEEGADKPEGEGEGEAASTEGKPVGEGEGDEQKEAETVPQSDTFAEGERAESPIGVGEKLSREGSPVQEDDKQVALDVLEPGTPERSRPSSEVGEEEREHLEAFEEEGELEDEEEEEEEEEEPEFDREAIIERYNRAINEREQLQQQNYQLQHKLAEHFRKKKPDDSRQDYDKNANDQDSKYVKYMSQLDELRKQDMEERDNYKIIIEELRKRCEEKKERVDEERNRFMEFKKQVAINSMNNRSGKPIPPKDIETYLSSENKKEADVVNVRLENIKLKNKLKKKEQQLKSKEELAAGLHLIDFEQLKIENQTYNEKIEERNEELLKLRKKITSTVQVLTHLKEKLQFVQAENQVQKGTLRVVESEVAQKRDILSRTKQARDALRIDNQRLRQSSGLLGNEPLLRDFEERKDEGDDLKQRLESLKMFHAELTLNCNQVRRKIEQAQAGRG